MGNISWKEIRFTDQELGITTPQLGYFLQITHSIQQDQDYAIVVDTSGKIHTVYLSEITFTWGR